MGLNRGGGGGCRWLGGIDAQGARCMGLVALKGDRKGRLIKTPCGNRAVKEEVVAERRNAETERLALPFARGVEQANLQRTIKNVIWII